MPQQTTKREEGKPRTGDKLEIWDYIGGKFIPSKICAVLHLGMKGWTIEADGGFLMDVVDARDEGRTDPFWREYRG